MSKITIDPALQKQFEESNGAVQIVGANGVSLGYFVPVPSTISKIPPGCEISEEELNRRRQKGGYITTAELLKRLESL